MTARFEFFFIVASLSRSISICDPFEQKANVKFDKNLSTNRSKIKSTSNRKSKDNSERERDKRPMYLYVDVMNLAKRVDNEKFDDLHIQSCDFYM